MSGNKFSYNIFVICHIKNKNLGKNSCEAMSEPNWHWKWRHEIKALIIITFFLNINSGDINILSDRWSQCEIDVDLFIYLLTLIRRILHSSMLE